MKTCKITFNTSKGLRFIKGEKYEINNQIGVEGIKLFRIYNQSGSFTTTQGHVNKFFN